MLPWSLSPARRRFSLGAVTVTALLACAAPASAVTIGPGCTLKQAVDAVNAQSSAGTGCGPVSAGGTTTINVPAGTYPLTGELKVNASRSAAIVGANPANPSATTIDAQRLSRVFEVASGGNLTLTAVKVTRGRTANGAAGTSGSPYGGSAADGGGILNAGQLSLDHVLVTDNGTGAGGSGATVAADLTGRAGGFGGNGGGIASTGGLTITASTISGNGTGSGGNGGNGADGQLGIGKQPERRLGWQRRIVGGRRRHLRRQRQRGDHHHVDRRQLHRRRRPGRQRRPRGGRGHEPTRGRRRQRRLRRQQRAAVHPVRRHRGDPRLGERRRWRDRLLRHREPHQLDDQRQRHRRGGRGRQRGRLGPARHQPRSVRGNQEGGIAGGGGYGAGLLSMGNGAGATLTNVTLAGNRAGNGGAGGAPPVSGTRRPGYGGFGGDGGGIWASGASGFHTVDLDHATIYGNATGAGGPAADTLQGKNGVGGAIRTGGRYSGSQATRGLNLKNTIIAQNGVPMCSQYYPPDNYIDIGDQGNNLRYVVVAVGQPADTSCPGTTGNPKLGSLADNGGPTATLLPGLGSAAINAGTCTVATDQRLLARPASLCDIGAVEFGARPGDGTSTSQPPPNGPTQPVVTPPRNVALPKITGTATAGRTLTVDPGTWTGSPPITFKFRWERCGASCAPIAGAVGLTYKLTSADVGKTIRVLVTGANGLRQATATSASRGPVAPSKTTVTKFLGKLLSPGGKKGKIGALLKAGGFKFSATAPSAGTLTLSWYQGSSKAKGAKAKKKSVLVATVKTKVKKAGRIKPKIKLTAKGKKLLKRSKKLKLTAKQTFTPKGGKATTVTKPIKLRR